MQAASPTTSSGGGGARIAELDALRGIAALAVVFHHLTRRYFEDFGRPPGSIPPLPFEGMHGVYLFFIISGFVISQTLSRTKSGRAFLIARASRIYPSFWLSVVLTFAAVSVFGLPGREVTLGEALVNLTMLQDHFRVQQVDSVYWSLTMEVSFYVIAYAAHSRGWFERHPTRFAWVWLGYSAAVALARRAFDYDLPENVKILTLPAFAPLFVAGIMFFLIRTGRGKPEMHAVIAACFVLHNVHSWHGKFGLALSACMFGGFYLLVFDRVRFLRARPLLFLGAISYPLYLMHDNIGMVLIRELSALGLSFNLALALTLGIVLLLSTATTHFLEKPAMAWLRTRFAKKPAS